VIEDVLKAEEEGVVKSLSGNDVHSELLQHADNDLLLQAQFWTMDQNPANLLGGSSEPNVTVDSCANYNLKKFIFLGRSCWR